MCKVKQCKQVYAYFLGGGLGGGVGVGGGEHNNTQVLWICAEVFHTPTECDRATSDLSKAS